MIARFSIALALLTAPLSAREPIPQTDLWDMAKLGQSPAVEWGAKNGLVREAYFAGEPFEGRPTKVFAYVGRPEGEGPFPGVVLVHGGGGRAFEKWAEHWAKRGYVSIAMDTAGNGPGKRGVVHGNGVIGFELAPVLVVLQPGDRGHSNGENGAGAHSVQTFQFRT